MDSTDRPSETRDLLRRRLVSSKAGVLMLGGERVCVLPAGVLGELYRDLHGTIGKAAAGTFFRAGEAHGRQLAEWAQTMTTAFPRGDVLHALTSLTRVWGQTGLGAVRLEDADPETSRYVVAIEHAITADAIPVAGAPVCSLYAGWLAGFLGAVVGQEFVVEEVACSAAGAARCVLEACPAE